MMTLIIGGSGSGKSAYAERYLDSLTGDGKKYYVATMQVFDEEGQKKIERHRRLRSGKGFLTIEQPTAIRKALEKMDTGKKSALLECVSNLTANEMFAGEKPKAGEAVAEEILGGIRNLQEQLTHLVIVSNNVFEDGRSYEEAVMEYIRAMGQINEKLAELADEVVEVVVGIPVVIKAGKSTEDTLVVKNSRKGKESR